MTPAERNPVGTAFQHDVFVSYAREDADWVMPNLYEPLLGCRLKSGERARIFLDVGPEGLGPGVDWTNELATAIAKTRVFLPVYSSAYFQKEMCQWELTMAWTQDPTGKHGRMSPVLIEPEAEESVPQKMSAINYVVTWRDDWFAMVCKQLGLVPEETSVQLEFVDQPTDTYVNHTLAPVRVRAIAAADGATLAPTREEEVTLSATSGILTGTAARTTEGGVATFDDLSIQTVEPNVCLVADAQGCVPAESDVFAVRKEPVSPGVGEDTIPARGAEEAIFLDDGPAVAVLAPGRAVVYDLAGEELASADLSGRTRVVRSSGAALGLVDWSGECRLLFVDGHQVSWRPGGDRNDELSVPGDMVMLDDRAYVGFWSGGIYGLDAGEGASLEVEHDDGVQALAVAEDLLCVADLEGRLCVYRGEELAGEAQLEPAIHLLKAYPGYLVAVGDRNLYQVPLDTLEPLRVFDQPHKLGEPAGTFAATELPVVVDGEGKGIRFSRDLEIRAKFHVVPGALPMSADRAGRYCAFRNPDGSRSLVRDDRIVLTHPAGVLAVSAAADRVALGDSDGVKILSADALDRLLAR